MRRTSGSLLALLIVAFKHVSSAPTQITLHNAASPPLSESPISQSPHAQLTIETESRSDKEFVEDRAGFYDPRKNGGSMLDRVNEWNGEPLNIIISAKSSPDVLRDSGFVAFTRSLGVWQECLDLHAGPPQHADLGDGQGWQPELYEMRESKFPYVGSCVESVIGGNHFRAWKQNGTLANSGAWFLAASKELDFVGRHKIIPNGYNIGRDLLVEKAIAGTRYRRRSWTTTVEWVEGLLAPGNEGVNHGIRQDGRIAVLTVTEY